MISINNPLPEFQLVASKVMALVNGGMTQIAAAKALGITEETALYARRFATVGHGRIRAAA